MKYKVNTHAMTKIIHNITEKEGSLGIKNKVNDARPPDENAKSRMAKIDVLGA